MVNQEERIKKIAGLLRMLLNYFVFDYVRPQPGFMRLMFKEADMSFELRKVLISEGYLSTRGKGSGTEYKLGPKMVGYSRDDVALLASAYYQHGQRNPKKGKALEKKEDKDIERFKDKDIERFTRLLKVVLAEFDTEGKAVRPYYDVGSPSENLTNAFFNHEKVSLVAFMNALEHQCCVLVVGRRRANKEYHLEHLEQELRRDPIDMSKLVADYYRIEKRNPFKPLPADRSMQEILSVLNQLRAILPKSTYVQRLRLLRYI